MERRNFLKLAAATTTGIVTTGTTAISSTKTNPTPHPKKIVDRYGWTRYYDEKGLPHRDDGPAVISNTGNCKIWYQHNILHRDDNGPSFISDYRMLWYKNGEKHRKNGPAVIRNLHSHPTKQTSVLEWWVNDTFKHREIVSNGVSQNWNVPGISFWPDGDLI